MKPTRHAGNRFFSGTLALVLLALAALPCSASAACSGKLAALQSYAGKYLANAKLLDAPALAAILARLPEDERLHLKRNLDVSGAIKLADCDLAVSGNAPHMGTEQDAMLDVDIASGTVTAAIHGGGRIDIYVIGDPAASMPDASWSALPRAVREWAVKADMGFPSQPPRSLAQPRSVRLHAPLPASTSNAAVTSTAAPAKVEDDIKPNPTQIAAIRRAAKGVADCKRLDQDCFSLSLADVNDDGRPDLLVVYSHATELGVCGTTGCGGVIILATAHGYADNAIELPRFNGMSVLAGTHHGMHDLQFDGDSPIWQWNGKDYAIPKADLPQSNMQPWKTAQASGRPLMAYVTPIDSVIKRVLVACEQGRPLLMVLTKQPLSTGSATLTFVFRGWTVNAPLQRNASNANLWMADLSRSQVPYWFAHRGFDANSRQIAPLVTESYLRINGEMQGQISMQDSTAATRTALSGCYRY